MEYSMASSDSNSSLNSPAWETEGSCWRTAPRRLWPTTPEHTQSKKQCSRVAWVGLGHCLQFAEEFGRILATLSSVGSNLWRSFHRKLVASEPMPFILALFQLTSHSVLGDASSDLDLMNSMVPSSLYSMVTSFSSSTLYHCAVVMVATFRGVLFLTHWMELNNVAE